MRTAGMFAVFLMTLVAEACPPAPTPPPGPDATSDAGPAPPAPSDAAPPSPPAAADASVDAGASVYARACANLQVLGCAEGVHAQCAAVLERAQTVRLTDFKPECLAVARTKAQARACGHVKCF